MDLRVYLDFSGKKDIILKNGETISLVREIYPLPGGHDLFYKVQKLALDGKHKGSQMDWGEWYAMLNKREILTLFNGVDVALQLENRYFFRGWNLLNDLPNDKQQYKVVASES
jgi:hypothetical protein